MGNIGERCGDGCEVKAELFVEAWSWKLGRWGAEAPEVSDQRSDIRRSGVRFRIAERRDSPISLAKVSQNRIDESEPGNGDRLVQLLLFLDLNLLKNRAVFCHVFAQVRFPSINDFFHFPQLVFVGPDAAAFRTFV